MFFDFSNEWTIVDSDLVRNMDGVIVDSLNFKLPQDAPQDAAVKTLNETLIENLKKQTCICGWINNKVGNAESISEA